MGRKTLYLTIKDLKELGIIGRKRKQRRNKRKAAGYNMSGVKSSSDHMKGFGQTTFNNTTNLDNEATRLSNEYNDMKNRFIKDGMKDNPKHNFFESNNSPNLMLQNQMDELKNTFNNQQTNIHYLIGNDYNRDKATIEELPDGYDYEDGIDVPTTSFDGIAEGNPEPEEKGLPDWTQDFGPFVDDYKANDEEIDNALNDLPSEAGAEIPQAVKKKYNVKGKDEKEDRKNKLIAEIKAMGGDVPDHISNNASELDRRKALTKRSVKTLLGEYISLGGENKRVKESNNINTLQKAINKLKK